MGGGGGGKSGPGPADRAVCQSRARGAGGGGKQDGAGGGEQAWRDQNALHLLKTATLSTGGDNFQFSLIGVDWSLWRLVHLVIEPKVRDQQGVSLYLDGGKQLLSLVGYGKTHIVLYPWHSGDWPSRGGPCPAAGAILKIPTISAASRG